MKKKIILASASPRRKELLRNIGLEFEVIPPDIDETIESNEFSTSVIENLACEKVFDVSKKLNYPAVIIGSDTMVVINNRVLGKPKDKHDAFAMLNTLSGKVHHVISSIAVYDSELDNLQKSSVISEVKFRKITDEEIKAYVKTEEPADKAGAYAIQGRAGVFVESIKGCYFNIVGISVFKLAEMLDKLGIKTF